MSTLRRHDTGVQTLLAPPDGGTGAVVSSDEVKGALAYRQGNTAEAIRHFEAAVGRNPGNHETQKILADLYYLAGDRADEAFRAYTRASTLRPDDGESLQMLASMSVERREYSLAKELFGKLVSLQPANGKAKQFLASVTAALSTPPGEAGADAPATLESFKAAILEVQKSMTDGRDNDATAALDRLMEMKLAGRRNGNGHATAPDPETLRQLATNGRHAEAMAGYREYVGTHPDDADAWNSLGVMTYRSGDTAGARTAYEKAVALQPAEPTYRKNLADLLFAEFDESEEALRLYVALLRDAPKDIEVLIALGNLTGALGKYLDATFFFTKVLEIDPGNPNAAEALAVLKNSTPSGPAIDPAKMVDDVRSALASHQRQKGLSLLSDLSRAGFHEQALSMYVDLLRRSPRDTSIMLGIAYTCQQLGRTDDAQEFFQRALALEPWNEEARAGAGQN